MASDTRDRLREQLTALVRTATERFARAGHVYRDPSGVLRGLVDGDAALVDGGSGVAAFAESDGVAVILVGDREGRVLREVQITVQPWGPAVATTGPFIDDRVQPVVVAVRQELGIA